MSDKKLLENTANELEKHVDADRRDLLKKALAGTAIYSVPLLTSFSMQGLTLNSDALAQPMGGNQVGVPTTNIWGLGAMAAGFVGALAWFKRRK